MRIPRIVLAFFLISLVLRVGFAVVTFRAEGTTKFVDDWDYLSYAENILEQGVFVPDISQIYSNGHLVGPGFPLIVAGMLAIFGQAYLPIMILNALISSLICILLYYLGKELFDHRVGLLAAGWSMIYVLHIYFVPRVLKHVWLAFLCPLAIYAYLLETKREGVSLKSLIPAFLFAFLIHMDERFFALFPLLLISFLFLDSISWRKGLQKAAVFFCVVVVLMIPWLVRNYRVYERPVILTARTAAFTDGLFGYESEKPPEFVWRDSLADSISQGKEVEGLKGFRYNSLKLGLKHGYVPHRFSKTERWSAEARELWRPVRTSYGYTYRGFRFEVPWSLKHNASIGLTYGVLLPFFLIGVVLIFKNRHRKGIFVIALIVLYTFIHVVLAHARNRYRVYIDAFIIVIAFYGLMQIYSLVRRRGKDVSQ
jgi:4-amino-4-deoxy-L-arabinose transferase-like glycosyltransferase